MENRYQPALRSYHSDRSEFVVVINLEKYDTIRINDPDELKAFLYNYNIDQLTQCVWESLRLAYKNGRRAASR